LDPLYFDADPDPPPGIADPSPTSYPTENQTNSNLIFLIFSVKDIILITNLVDFYVRKSQFFSLSGSTFPEVDPEPKH